MNFVYILVYSYKVIFINIIVFNYLIISNNLIISIYRLNKNLYECFSIIFFFFKKDYSNKNAYYIDYIHA